MNIEFAGDPSTSTSIALTGTSSVLAPGVVTNTINPQVAQYTITPPFDATVTVSFGPDTSYAFSTSSKTTATGGGPVSILVVGMKATSTYHLRATVNFTNGIQANDVDQTFTTGAVPAGVVPPLTVTPTSGLTPQPGIELVDSIKFGPGSAAYATDLAGNVIWTYPFPDKQPTSYLYPIKPLPNGDLILMIGPNSTITAPVPVGTLGVLREIDLAGNIVCQLTMDDLNTALQVKGLLPDSPLQVFSHEITLLPNGTCW